MAFSPNQKYPGATDPNPNYKDGVFRDNSPATTNNGSPLKAIDRNERLSLDEAVMDAAGFDYNGQPDTPQNSQLFQAYKAALGNGANLLSNHNFLIASPDDSQPPPDATPRTYPPGFQIFRGVFANETTGILNLTYIDGRVSFSGGDFYMPVPNTGGVERLTEFVSSVADFDGKPRTRGVSFALVGDEYRITVGVDALEDVSANPTPLGSVKFEQGGVATGHEVQREVDTSTEFEKTWHVDPSTGDDSGDGTSSNPFLTIQRAIDVIPVNVLHRQTIQLADGIHNQGSRNTNPIQGASTVRSVRCLVDGKNVSGREMIVIQGNTTDKTLCTIQHNDVYSAVYAEETNGVVVKDVTLDFSLNPDAAISIFQHRRGDMRCSDITVNGNDKNGSHAFIAETGGFIEFAGDIEINNTERALVSLEAVISFIGTRLSHDGGTAGAPRTFECGSQGQIYMFSGLLNTDNVQRVIWNKGGFVLCSPSSHTHSNVFGFAIDIVEGAAVEARRVSVIGGAVGLNNQGGLATLNLCNFNNQTTSAVVNRLGGKVTINDCSLGDNTQTKALVDSEGGEVYIFGDGDITGGSRGVYAKNTQLEIGEQMNISGNTYNIDARECITRIVGTLANPVTMNGGLENSIKTIGGSLHHQYLNATGISGKNVIDAIGTVVHNGGNVNLDGGYIGVNLSQNASYTAEGTSPNQIHNMTGFGIRANRGSQVYYRTSAFTFTGTATPTIDYAAEFSLVTSF